MPALPGCSFLPASPQMKKRPATGRPRPDAGSKRPVAEFLTAHCGFCHQPAACVDEYRNAPGVPCCSCSALGSGHCGGLGGKLELLCLESSQFGFVAKKYHLAAGLGTNLGANGAL